ncbi:gamma carbonic anhydrase family protein [Mesorhizobium sp. 2RAF21]|uniref:gamma carbonic anhydrase family protein n=1 Tax=Mesorhizobium sp. 2RAF21 TaxID=3232995 RepID=UPI003F9BD48C
MREQDPEAARLLLAHSVALGHERLGVRRYLVARHLGVPDVEAFRPFYITAARQFSPHALQSAADTVARELHLVTDAHGEASKPLVAESPFFLPYGGLWPKLESGPQYCGIRVSLLGALKIGSNPWFGPSAVIRADGHFVRIGADFRIGECSTVHIAHELFPTVIGNRVTVGRNAVVHGCTVGDDCVIEDGVVVLDGAQVEDGVLIESNSVVFPRSTLKAGLIYSGSPARPIGEIGNAELQQRRQAVSNAIFACIFDNASKAGEARLGEHAFVAATASLSGTVQAGAKSGIFFGCRLNAVNGEIVIGENSNIQDNTIIDGMEGSVAIGSDSTIGHNVCMGACRIGDRALVGIGSNLAKDTRIDDDVLLAAGSITMAGQHLQGGWLWGGRPARAITKLDDAKRAMMSATIEQYRVYGAQYKIAQSQRASEEV